MSAIADTLLWVLLMGIMAAPLLLLAVVIWAFQDIKNLSKNTNNSTAPTHEPIKEDSTAAKTHSDRSGGGVGCQEMQSPHARVSE